MKLVLDVKESFGELLYLGFSKKMKYDTVTNKKTDEVEGFICRMASSELGGQIEVTVPTIVAVENIAFAQKITLERAIVDPYARTTEGSAFAEVILRCNAENILDATKGIKYGASEEEKPGENKPGENKQIDKK